MRIIVLSDDCCRANNLGLRSEHGLSLYIEHNNQKIIFDTGASDNFINNAQKLGIDISLINKLIISHPHNDHIGGLDYFLKENQIADIYISPYIFKKYYFKFGMFKLKIGDQAYSDIYTNYSNRFRFVSSTIKIAKDMFLITGIKGKDENFLIKENLGYKEDTFDYEITLLIKNNYHLNVVTGCSHAGIKNILDVVQLFSKRIYNTEMPMNVIGGLHLIKFAKFNLGTLKKDSIN